MNVTLNFTHLPPFPEYMLDLCKFPRVYGPMRPVCMEGFVIAMTRVTKYTQGARFLCVNDDCPCSTGKVRTKLISPSLFKKSNFPYLTWIYKHRLVLFYFEKHIFMWPLGFHHIRVHTPGATESATVRNDFTCMVCSSQLKEDMKFRVLGGEGVQKLKNL